MKMLFLILFSASIILTSCEQKNTTYRNPNQDKIEKYLRLAEIDTLALKNRIYYKEEFSKLLDIKNNDSTLRQNIYQKGILESNFRQHEKCFKTSELLEKLSVEKNDKYGIGCSYKLKGLYYMFRSENEKAIMSFYKAKKIFQDSKKTILLIPLMIDISTTQYYCSDFLGSNKTLFENLNIVKKFISENPNKYEIKIKRSLSVIYFAIADNYFELKEFKKAIDYYKLSLKTQYDLGTHMGLIKSYIGSKYYKKAETDLKKILNNKKIKLISPEAYGNALLNFEHLKLLQKKSNVNVKNLIYANKIFTEINSPFGINYAQLYLSQYYAIVKDTTIAIQAAQKAVYISKKYKNPNDVLVSLNQLIKVDKKNASKNALEYIRINDSLQIAERNFRDKFANIVYETEKLKKEKQNAIEQKGKIITSSIIGLFLFIFLFVIYRQRMRQKELLLEKEQQKANDEIYQLMLSQKSKEENVKQNEKKRIAKELHDNIMNKLASTRLNLFMLTKKRDDASINTSLNYIETIHDIEQEIRNIAHDLHLQTFCEKNSYVAMLNDFVTDQNKTQSCNYELELDDSIDWNFISDEIKMNFYRIIQEASNNINKHAHASNVLIAILKDHNNICMSVVDNGNGFKSDYIKEGMGIQNMKCRIQSLNGKISFHSIENKNTIINISVPC